MKTTTNCSLNFLLGKIRIKYFTVFACRILPKQIYVPVLYADGTIHMVYWIMWNDIKTTTTNKSFLSVVNQYNNINNIVTEHTTV